MSFIFLCWFFSWGTWEEEGDGCKGDERRDERRERRKEEEGD